MSVATATTAPPGAPAVPQEAPTLNPSARVVGTPASEADLPEAQAAARRAEASDAGPGPAVGLALLAGLVVAGATLAVRALRRPPG